MICYTIIYMYICAIKPTVGFDRLYKKTADLASIAASLINMGKECT